MEQTRQSPSERCAEIARVLRRTLAPLLFLTFIEVLAPAAVDPTDYLFRSTNLLRLKIEMTDQSFQALRDFRREPRVRVPAVVYEGDAIYTDVLVQLKGRGSFQGITGNPSLTLHFGKSSDRRTFHGLRRLSLNNAAQDPTCLQEKLARELFAAADVPVARADHALLTLNGRELGIYVLTEGYDRRFLKRHFKRTDGTFFDGGLFEDIDHPLEAVSGDKTNFHGLQRAVAACFEADPSTRFSALQETVDLDRFVSLIALETILCHFDGYAMRRTNYRVYDDPGSNRLVFMPQGMDRVLGNFRRHLDLPLTPPMVGMVARALLDTRRGRELYLDRLGTLFTNSFNSDDLVLRVHALDRKIANYFPRPEWRWDLNPRSLNRVVSSGNHAQDVEDLCERIGTRANYLKTMLAASRHPAATPLLSVTGGQPVELPAWSPRAVYLQPPAIWTPLTNGWHARTAGPYTALGCRIRLPPGRYHLTGRVKAAGNPEIPRIMIRHFVTPFTPEFQPDQWQDVTFNFQIAPGPAPEEIDLLCEVRGAGEAWVDSGSFRIEREVRAE